MVGSSMSDPGRSETVAAFEYSRVAGTLALGSWAFATAQRWRTECGPGWRAALPGAPVRGDQRGQVQLPASDSAR